MDDLKRMAVFAAVVQHGSMSGAARALGMSTSAVSQQVRKLESDGGVTLLHRSTRKLALTDAGQRYHAGCAAMCAAAEQARAELAASRDAPSGELRLSATVGFARHVAPALGALLAEHPALRLRLLVDDAPIDLINTRIDLAVRFGKKSGEVTKKTCIVIVEVKVGDECQDMGVVVDAVNAVLEIPRSDIEPAPAFGSKIRTDFIEGMGKVNGNFVILLNVSQVLSVDELGAAGQVASQAQLPGAAAA